MGVSGEDELAACGGEGFGHFGVVGEGDGEIVWVEGGEGLGDVGGLAAHALQAADIDFGAVGAVEVDLAALVVQDSNVLLPDAAHEFRGIVVALDHENP